MSRYPTRPRIWCRNCGRSIAVTINKRTGQMYVRSHVEAPGVRCPGSGRTLPSGDPVHYKAQEVRQ